jgi:ATP-dependent DNA helicase RecG
MKIKEISKDDALALASRDESHFFDHKALAVSGQKTQKISTAFANADGGEFIIGINDSKDEPDINKRWQGANKIEDFNSHLQSISEISPTLDFSVTFLTCKELPGMAMLIKIEKSASVHETSAKEIYVRQGAQSLKITDKQKVIELQFAKGATSFEDFVVTIIPPETVYESVALKYFLSDFSPRTEPLEYVISENLIDLKNFDPRVSGLLLFAKNPSACLPRKCAVKIIRYETKEDEPERDYLKETISIEGPSYQLIHDTVQKVTEIMSGINVWTPEGLRSMSYPPEAIWEIITNAIIHRDYSISDDVQILIFDNRIEVLSPGKLPGYVTLENILDSRFSRNHKLVRTLSKYKNAPNKDIGEGLNTAFEKMKEWKLKSPIIEEVERNVKVTIPHTPLARPTELILEFLSHEERINNRQAREITGIKSENLVKIEFYKLRDEGLLERIPGLEGPAAAWRLTAKGKKHVGT